VAETKKLLPKKYCSMALLTVGSKAPDFSVNDQNGVPVTLREYRGKKVVLYFYPQDLTPTCTKQACNLRDHYKALQKNGYEVLGVSADNEKKHQKFIAKEKLPFRLLADTDKKLHELYGTWGAKFTFGRHYMGTLRTTYVINEKGLISDVIGEVESGHHAEQILGGAAQAKPTAKKVVTKKAAKKI
jgi:thioredoxin-dependent peroxiredoxin